MLSDYKESEKIPGELAASIDSIYRDSKIMCVNDKKMCNALQSQTRDLLHAITSGFRQNAWKSKEIRSALDLIDGDIRSLAEKGVGPPFLIRVRNELTNIEKTTNRIQTIMETSFIPAAYAVAQLGVFAVIAILLFVDIVPTYKGLALVGATSALLIGLILLIKDMDNPFEVGKGTYGMLILDTYSIWKSTSRRSRS